MKFLAFSTYHVDKMEELVKVSDKLAANARQDYKILAMYSCLANPFSISTWESILPTTCP